MKLKKKLLLYKTLVILGLCCINPIIRIFTEQSYSISSEMSPYPDSFEGKLVDGLKAQDCNEVTPYNLVFMPYMSQAQKDEFSKKCQQVIPENNSASIKETVYNLNKIKGFGQNSASKIVQIIWGDYEK
jgi:hypothetical protein